MTNSVQELTKFGNLMREIKNESSLSNMFVKFVLVNSKFTF